MKPPLPDSDGTGEAVSSSLAGLLSIRSVHHVRPVPRPPLQPLSVSPRSTARETDRRGTEGVEESTEDLPEVTEGAGGGD